MARLLDELRGAAGGAEDRIAALTAAGVLPPYFADIAGRLAALRLSPPQSGADGPLVAGGSDLYVQRLHELEPAAPRLLLRELPPGIRCENGDVVLSATTAEESSVHGAARRHR
jgi:hypothetical protein